MHYDSLHRLVHTPVTFFDTTPVGRILNRFSKDTDDMDYQLCVLPYECVSNLNATVLYPTDAHCHPVCSLLVFAAFTLTAISALADLIDI